MEGSLCSVLLNHITKWVYKVERTRPGCGWFHSWEGFKMLLCPG